MRGYPPPIEELRKPPETVGIEFEERLIVWHYFQPRDDPDFGYEEFGPSATVVYAADSEEERLAAADSLQRFLSALAFHFEQPVDTVGLFSGSSTTDPYGPAIVRHRKQFMWWSLHDPPAKLEVRPERSLRVGLAYFREGVNATSPFYSFLAFWNCLDAVFDVVTDPGRRDQFIRTVTPRFEDEWEGDSLPADMAKHLERESRHALAHVIREPGRRRVNPDEAQDRVRLTYESRLLRRVARAAIEEEFPDAVSATLIPKAPG